MLHILFQNLPESFDGFVLIYTVIVVWVTDIFVKYFEKYGEITDYVIMKDRHTGRPRGFGFITFADPSVVDQLMQETHVINDKQVSIICFYVVYSVEVFI